MDAAVAFGRWLSEARQARVRSREELSRTTGVPLAHVEALEEGHLDALPVGMYRRAEVRAYAEGVGLDPAHALHLFHQALQGVTAPEFEHAGRAPVPAPAPPAADLPSPAFLVPGDGMLEGAAPVAAAAATPNLVTRPGVRERRSRKARRSPSRARRERPARPALSPARTPIRVLVLAGLGLLALSWEQADLPNAPAAPAPPMLELPLGMAVRAPADPFEHAARDARKAPALANGLFVPRTASLKGAWRRYSALDEGVLVIRSTPSGARVTINGVGWGETPVTVRHLPFGPQRVRLVKDRYASYERVVTIARDRPVRTLQWRLTSRDPRPARASASAPARDAVLVVTSVPVGARVTVNGIGWGATPVTIRHLPPGPQRVRVAMDRYASEERVVELGAGGTSRVAVTLRGR